MKGCINCASYKSSEMSIMDEFKKPNICLDGHNKKMQNWWDTNGKKTSADTTIEDMECFKQTESSKSLEKMMELLNKLEKVIDENKLKEK